MPDWEFPGSDPVDAFIEIAAGRVAVNAAPVTATTVTVVPSRSASNAGKLVSEVSVSFDPGQRLEVVGPRRSGFWRGHAGFNVTVTVPEGSRCVLRTASADVTSTGSVAELDAHTASGDITAATVTGRIQAETSSGDVKVERAGMAEIRTASGDVRLKRADGEVLVRTASGDVTIGSAAGSVSAATASGDVRLGGIAAGRAEMSTASGDATVGVVPGTGVYLDLASVTGSVTSQLDEAAPSEDVPLEVKCRTVSGDIRIVRASGADMPSRAPQPPSLPGPDAG